MIKLDLAFDTKIAITYSERYSDAFAVVTNLTPNIFT